NLWGNVGAMLSPLIAGILADLIGWTWTLQSLIILVAIAILMWFFVKPDSPLVVNRSKM
ncbi:MFS transporter, partial [Staphylococcus epidermidis]